MSDIGVSSLVKRMRINNNAIMRIGTGHEKQANTKQLPASPTTQAVE